MDVFVHCGLSKSKSDAIRLINEGGCYMNDIRITENRELSTDDLIYWKYILIRKGKKNYHLLIFNDVEYFFK